MQVRDNGASSWFNAVALEEQDLTLNRRPFRDSLHLHYNLQLVDLPSHCACGDRFTVSHALSCKKTDFVAQRHDRIQNLLTFLLSKICKEVEVEPMRHSTQDPPSQVRPEARQDIKAESFWSRGETAFSDVYFTTWEAWEWKEKEVPELSRQELLTWKWDLLSSWFLARMEEWGENANFFWASKRTNFPEIIASRMPVPYLGLKHAYLLKF